MTVIARMWAPERARSPRSGIWTGNLLETPVSGYEFGVDGVGSAGLEREKEMFEGIRTRCLCFSVG